MIDDIAIDLWYFLNFANIEDIRKKCNPMVNLSQFTSKIYIYIYIYIEWSRLVHGSVWVEFVPNLELTRPDQIVRILTRHRPKWLIGSDGPTFNRWRSVWLELEISKLAKIRQVNCKISKISMIFLSNYRQIWWNLTDSARYHQI